MSSLAVPNVAEAQLFKHSDAESTELTQDEEDTETLDSDSSQHLTPRTQCAEVEEHCPCSVVVNNTFIDVSDGSLLQRFRRLRRAQTDSALVAAAPEEEYQPGKFSDDCAKLEAETSHSVEGPCRAQAPAERTLPAKQHQTSKTRKQAGRSTVMLRNVPNNYTREMFLEMLDHHGFAGRYDFAYLPCDFNRDANLGYAFVNMVDAAAVDDVWTIFSGFTGWSLPTAKVCEVRWSGPHQGFEAHVERFRNSPVMHRSVPDKYKPVIFRDGTRRPFPRPTKKVKAPTAGLF